MFFQLLTLPLVLMLAFQSTHPVRGGTPLVDFPSRTRENFNPPTPCGAGHADHKRERAVGKISIHPPHAGRDRGPLR